MAARASNFDEELARRYRATSTTVHAVMILTIVVTVIGWFVRDSIYRPGNAWAEGGVPVAIVVLAIGAMAFRRTRFQSMRLQDIAAVDGVSGLLRTLQNTTLSVAFVALAIVLIGIIGMIASHSFVEVLRAGAVALVLLIYGYPKKGAWQRVVNGISVAGDAQNRVVEGGNR